MKKGIFLSVVYEDNAYLIGIINAQDGLELLSILDQLKICAEIFLLGEDELLEDRDVIGITKTLNELYAKEAAKIAGEILNG